MFNTTKSKIKKIRQLQDKGGADSVRKLAQMLLKPDGDEVVRGEIARALGEIDGEDVVLPLLAALQSPSAHARAAAAEALGRKSAVEAVPELISTLDDPDDVVRMKAAEALGWLGDERAIVPLARKLGDAHWGVHTAAAQALVGFSDATVFQSLCAWIEKFLMSTQLRLDTRQKLGRVHDLMTEYFRGLDEPTVRLLSSSLPMQTRVKAWELMNPTTEAYGWVITSHKNPVWKPAQERLEELKREFAQRNPPAPEPPAAAPEPLPGSGEATLLPDDEAVSPFAAMNGLGASIDNAGVPLDELDGRSPFETAGPTAPTGQPPGSLLGSFIPESLFDMDDEPDFKPARAATSPAPEPNRDDATEEWKAEEPTQEWSRDEITEEWPAAVAEGYAAPGTDDEATSPDAPEPEPETVALPISRTPVAALPPVAGVVADFLEFLNGLNVRGLVLTGGAARDAALGREPRNLDLAFDPGTPLSLDPATSDPVDWNLSFGESAGAALRALADALRVSLDDLLAGNAVFSLDDKSLPVRYVGPYVVEEKTTERTNGRYEQRVFRKASLLGLVADRRAGRVSGLRPDPLVNRIWISPDGSWGGNVGAFARQTLAGEFDAEIGPDAGWDDFLRLLRIKRTSGLALNDASVERLESLARRLRERPIDRGVFPRAEFESLLSNGSLESVAREFDLLDLVARLADVPDDPLFRRIEEKLADIESEKAVALASYRQRLESALAERDRIKETYEGKHARFRDHFGRLDVSRTTKNDLEVRLRAKIEELADVDRNARSAQESLNEATRRFKAIAKGEDVDTRIIQEHREALSENRKWMTRLEGLKDDVESLRKSVALKLRSTLQLQEEMERLGQELEVASDELKIAQEAADAARAELDRMEADFLMSPQRRLALLKGSA